MYANPNARANTRNKRALSSATPLDMTIMVLCVLLAIALKNLLG